ncbi:TPA: hypothetical protein ACP7Q5_005074, partial [Escherichia coli]
MKPIMPRSFSNATAPRQRAVADVPPAIEPEDAQQQALQTQHVDNVSRTEDAVDAEKDQGLVSRLDYETWLPFAAKTYKISPRIEDYIIVSTLVCPSDIPNRNG